METGEVRLGTVLWFSADKGHGYVRLDDGSEEVRVEAEVAETGGFRVLLEGQRVEVWLSCEQGEARVMRARLV